ncbi:uncharacterized protein EI90DRAFT_3019106 [Cantharellus anzutake]|uniref:uncharacterized protein n=1 Tax=Cantharellus anzutake TaxID=1750568 RepID=UPI0019050C5D|nr:uncharacterized protein EI90DRAFT_3019106 [Cantharellus anzutake]KAF8325308.1 hypothetical protein EI90DRAFT_3019106 [Cantharellus anzutake]
MNTDRSPNKQSYTPLPVHPSGHQVSINPTSRSSLKELESHSLLVRPSGCQVPVNPTSGNSLKELLYHSLPVPDSTATSSPWGDVRTSPEAVQRGRDLTLIIEAIREFEGGVFNDPDTPMTKIRNWQRIMPAWLERELVPDDSAKPTLQYRLAPLD